MRNLVVTVPQGVGDIFWIYQKLANHCDSIEFQIAVTNTNCKIQSRSELIILALPKVASIRLKKVGSTELTNIINSVYDLKKLLARGDTFNYSLNKLLDSGVKLEKIDSLSVAYDIKLQTMAIKNMPEKYCVFYVSGTTSNKSSVKRMRLWDFEQWAELINSVSLPVVLIGAEFDLDAQNQIKKLCPQVIIKTQLKPENLFWMLENAEYFVGFQSGLSVLADNLATKHLIVYFDHLKLMTDSWAHPDRRSMHFRWCLFSDGIDTAKRIINDFN